MDSPLLRSRAPRLIATVVTVAALGVALGGSAAGSATGSKADSAAQDGLGVAQARTVAQSRTVVQPRAAVLTPVRAGNVPNHLNVGLLAARAQEDRDAQVRARLDATLPAKTEEPSGVRELAAAVLAELPGGSAVEIAWNHPDIGNHLGGVRLDKPTVMMLNSHRFEAQPERVVATVKHEIAHYYQGAVIAAHADAAGGWWDAYWQLDAALKPVFGAAWMERSADCVALHLGADWTNYTSECSGKAKRGAVKALVAGRMP